MLEDALTESGGCSDIAVRRRETHRRSGDDTEKRQEMDDRGRVKEEKTGR